MIEEEGVRRERLLALRQEQVNPYPASATRTHTTADFSSAFDTLLSSQEPVTLVGRVLAIRKHGGMSFLVLEDAFGRVQIALKRDDLGTDRYQHFHDRYDRGDFVEIQGMAYVTSTKEPTVLARNFRMLTKTLLPLPEKWHGLSDTEIRYRKRYLDLASNPEVRHTFRVRAAVVKTIRDFLHEEGFLEVDTPILQTIPGGADARPFVTHHNALDTDLYLRIAPELFLKRCLVGGFERVFEIARCFRNEGISFQHNPEFTQVEAYLGYGTIEDLMDHLERLLSAVVKAATGGNSTVTHDGDVLDFTPPFARKTFFDLVLAETGLDLSELETEDKLRAAMMKKKMDVEGVIGYGELADLLYKTAVRPKIIQPTFVTEYPAAMKPLAKRTEHDPHRSANVQLVVKGMEVVNGFNELNDPLEQEMRFKEQEALRERGSEAAQRIDEDYLEALKVGMPPAAGYGMGIDRLCTLLTNTHNIKEVILFPTLKPEDET